MTRLIKLLLFCLLFSSCTNNQRQLDNEKNILGDWVSVDTGGLILQPPLFLVPGYTFSANHVCDKKSGYFKHVRYQSHFYEQDESPEEYIYLGSTSKFRLVDDSLEIFNLENHRWSSLQIVKLNADSLKLQSGENVFTYKHLPPAKYKSIKFDKIILSTSECFGPCPITNTILNADGDVIFNGKYFTSQKGLFKGEISQKQYQLLQDNFAKTNIDKLKTKYAADWTDSQTITTTFVKDGKIYKTITDYAKKAPLLFEWASVPISYLYQSIPLKKIDFPIFAQDSTNIISTRLINGNMVLDLKESESFLLFDYLRNGKTSNANFKERFKMKVYYTRKSDKFYNLATDGRYYKFIINGKPTTIDIGFNFFDVNASNWIWRKVGEYD